MLASALEAVLVEYRLLLLRLVVLGLLENEVVVFRLVFARELV